VKDYVVSLAPLAVLLMLACAERETMLGDSGESGTGAGSMDGGVDCEGDAGDGDGDGDAGDGTDDETDDGTTGDDTTGDGDCELGEYVASPINEEPDWSSLSGVVSHGVSHTPAALGPSTQSVYAAFYTTDWVDDSRLCIESIVEPTGVDSCWVWYTQGQGLGGDRPDNWYEDLPVQSVTLDVGGGPIVLDVAPGNELNPSWYSAVLPSPPAGVPFGDVASLDATFDNLPAVALDLEVPSDVLPLGHALDTTTLSSEELASWTWATPGGAAPAKLEVMLADSPAGSGWSEWVAIQCEVTDDGEFAFPVEYLDLARERLGQELHASVRLTREATGTMPLAGKQLLWRSNITAWLNIEVVD
jgi:hypothetical protein